MKAMGKLLSEWEQLEAMLLGMQNKGMNGAGAEGGARNPYLAEESLPSMRDEREFQKPDPKDPEQKDRLQTQALKLEVSQSPSPEGIFPSDSPSQLALEASPSPSPESTPASAERAKTSPTSRDSNQKTRSSSSSVTNARQKMADLDAKLQKAREANGSRKR